MAYAKGPDGKSSFANLRNYFVNKAKTQGTLVTSGGTGVPALITQKSMGVG